MKRDRPGLFGDETGLAPSSTDCSCACGAGLAAAPPLPNRRLPKKLLTYE